MGLIRSATTAIGSTFADEWKEYFYADSIKNGVAVVKGQKRVGAKTSNKHGSDNIISKGSAISVNVGQAMIIVEDGKISEYSDEPGVFIYDSSTESSIFSNTLGKGISETFSKIGRRFTYGGDTGKDQRVYYFNIKELTDLKFGTSEPIMYDDPVYQSISIRFFGQAVLKIMDPILFYTNVSGNVATEYSFYSYWDQILRAEFISKISESIARLALNNIKYNQITQNQTMLTDFMNECLDDVWGENRGIVVHSVGIQSISLDPKDKEKINKIDEMRLLHDPLNAAARMTGATANAMEKAAANENGAMNAFMGLNMATMQGQSNNLMGMYQNANTLGAQNVQSNKKDTWTCSCGTENEGNFCKECGSKKIEKSTWTCSCGTENEGKFCKECGAKKPENNNWTCSCGTTNEGNFCKECGNKKP